VGRLAWNSDFNSLYLGLTGGNVNLVIGQDTTQQVFNAESTTLNKGEVVYIFGALGDKISVKRASNLSDATSAKTFGVVADTTIASGAIGYVTSTGVVTGLDLSSYSEGDILWLGTTAGTYQVTKPQAPNHIVFIGVVLRNNNGNGLLYVKPQNGYELDEIHDVLISGTANNDLLTYESSTGLWKNKSFTTLSIATGSGTTNYVPRWLSSNNLSSTSSIYDNGLNVGIGITSSTFAKLHVNNTGSSYSFLVEDSTNPDSTPFIIDSSGNVGIGTTSLSYPFQIVTTNNQLYYYDDPSGGLLIFGGNTGIPRVSVDIPSYLTKPAAGLAFGMRSWDDVNFETYGKVGDGFIRASQDNNGLNIINAPGSLTEDYIRLYAGQNATPSNIPDIHIQGSGLTRGFVGIGTTGPSQLLTVGQLGNALVKTLYIPGQYNFDGVYLSNFNGNGGGKLELVAHTNATTAGAWRISSDNDIYPQSLVFSRAGSTSSYEGLSYSQPYLTIEQGGNVGIGLTSPSYKLQVSGNFGDLRYDPNSIRVPSRGSELLINGTSSKITSLLVASGDNSFEINNVGTTYTDSSIYGTAGDVSLYASSLVKNLNIVNQIGPGSDNIRFYAGQDATPGNTPDIHITGNGASRGYVGIGTSSATHLLTLGKGGGVSIYGSNSGYVYIKSRDNVNSWTASLPVNKGNISQFVYNNFGGEMMLNDGEGNLYFGTTPSLYLPTTQVFIGNTYSYAVGRTFSGDMYNDYTGAVTINNGVVSYVKMQTISQKAVLGSTNVSGGVVTELPLYNSYISIGTASSYLENNANWTGVNYTGPSITDTYQGQNHYNGTYFYTAVDDNLWIRFARA
jgi:hypothetical protein